ncbi:MAG TPA: hypothetical protein VG165_04065 [Solirubrobacteraceae bacterium]|jgi:hypothetical protein|nr:hypothetical protein [Solirubrobacteraceae bacterium]
MSHPVPNQARGRRGRLARFVLTGALSAGLMVAVPAAQADTLSTVRTHVHRADTALAKVLAAAQTGSVSGPLSSLEAAINAAGVNAANLYKHAHTASVRVNAAAAMDKVAAQENRDAAALTPMIGQLTGTPQSQVASVVAAVTQGREEALSLVSALIPKLPVVSRTAVAGTVASLSDSGTGQVGQLVGSISPNSIACTALNAVGQVVATVVASVQSDLSRVQGLASMLPAGGTSQFSSIISGLPGELTSLVGTLQTAFNCTPATGSTPATVGVGGVTSLVSSITNLVQGILGSFLPSLGGGSSSGPVAGVPVTGLLSGLLGSVTSTVPSFGGLLGGGSGGLLGGILGLVPGGSSSGGGLLSSLL